LFLKKKKKRTIATLFCLFGRPTDFFSFFGFREIDFVGVSFESGKRSGVIKEANTTQR